MMVRGCPRRWVLWLPLFLGGGRAYAQDWDDFYLEKIFGEIGIGLELWDEERGTGASKVEQQEVRPRVALTLGTLGYYYHPKLVEFNLRGTLQYEQQWVFVKGPQPDQTYNNQFPDWDLRARVFKDHPYGGELYSQRAETWARQSFFPTIRSTVTETGLNLGAREWVVPSNFHYHHYTFESRGGSTQDEVRDVFSLGGGESLGDHEFNYRAEYDSAVIEHLQRSYDTYSLRASSKHSLGGERDVSWYNRANLRSQVGDLNSDYTSASSSLNARFTPNLDGSTGIEFDRSDSESSFSETLRWRGDLKHQLYKSLVSSGNVLLQENSLAGGDIGLAGVGGNLDYRKQTPVGQLGLRYGLNYYIQDQDSLQGQTPIFDEPHVYVLGVPIFLDNQSVDAATVRITDVTSLILYTEGLDYFLVADGNLLRVDIPIGSLILPGQTILISYDFEPSPAHSFSNVTHTTGFDFTYGDIADLRLGYQTTGQDLKSGTDPGNLTDTVTTTADFQVHPLATTVGLHYRRYESDFAPYERRSVRFSADRPIWEASMWRLQAENYRTDFLEDDGSEHGSSINAQLTSSLGRTSFLELRGEWFKINYRVDRGDGYSLELSWKRRIRDLEIALRLRYLDEQFQVATDHEIGSLSFSLTRKF